MNIRPLILGAFAIAIVSACDEKRPFVSDPIGPYAYGFQMTQAATNLPRGAVTFKFHATPAAVTPESIVVSLQGIDSLGSGFYTAWAGDSLGTTFKRIAGVLEGVVTDTTLDALGNIISTARPRATISSNVSAIQNGSVNTAYTWRFERANAGLTPQDSMVVLLITIEETSSATTPSPTRRPLFARRNEGTAATGARTNAPLRFGNYKGNPAEQYVYSSTPARGRGVIWGDVLQVTDSTLARPPLGYYYAVFAIKNVPRGSSVGDTLFLGDLTVPYPRRGISLYTADSVRTDPEFVLDVPPSVQAGSARISSDTGVFAQLVRTVREPGGQTRRQRTAEEFACTGYPAGVKFDCPYAGYSEIRLTLESKNASRGRMGPARVLSAPFPFVVTAGQR